MKPARRRPSESEAPRRVADRSGSVHPIAELAPDPAAPIPAVRLKADRAAVRVFRKRLERVEGARHGDLVAVYDPQDQLLGYGLYNGRSEIAVRMLFYSAELPSDADWDALLERAAGLRHATLRIPEETDAYRLIHAEADGLSGLTVDRFGGVLSAEAFSLGMYRRAEAILRRLAVLCGTQHAVIQTSPQFLAQEGVEPPTLLSPGCPREVVIREFGTRFRVRFEGGHKTGFFCDQRENRRRLAAFCRGKSVLDVCCYTGGFAVQAKTLGAAADVTGVDLDEQPLALARENAGLNQARIKFVQADAFAFMRDLARNGRTFDVVVLDPPKLIRSRSELEEGTKKHFDLNRLAMRLVKPGGLLLSCSCAGLLPESEFIRLLAAAARQGGDELPGTAAGERPRHAARMLQILAKTGAAADHPVAAHCLETEYLKAVWMIVS
jgi:23S rRNA (cytosine1962-C5)-methyltransferase